MKHAGDIGSFMAAYPERRFRVIELVRHVTHGRVLSPREREATRKAVRRVLETMVENGIVFRVTTADSQGGYDEYSMSRKWDIGSEKVGQKVGQYGRAFAP